MVQLNTCNLSADDVQRIDTLLNVRPFFRIRSAARGDELAQHQVFDPLFNSSDSPAFVEQWHALTCEHFVQHDAEPKENSLAPCSFTNIRRTNKCQLSRCSREFKKDLDVIFISN